MPTGNIAYPLLKARSKRSIFNHHQKSVPDAFSWSGHSRKEYATTKKAPSCTTASYNGITRRSLLTVLKYFFVLLSFISLNFIFTCKPPLEQFVLLKVKYKAVMNEWYLKALMLQFPTSIQVVS